MERKISDGLWIGDMAQIPYRPTFDAVMTVNEEPGHVDEEIHHRWVAMTDSEDPQIAARDKAARWVQAQWEEGRDVLVRSKNGVNRPAYVLAKVFINMGAEHAEEAIEAVARRTVSPLQNDTFIDALYG